jgi:hypothetical protein
VVCLATLGIAPVLSQSAAATSPTHGISVSGAGAAMYPAFSPSVHRYAITTTDATAGTVVVTASTSDASGSVWVDGQPAAGGMKTLTGLVTGDEISVFIKDKAGTAIYSLFYLPVGFPTLTAVTKKPGIAPGDVFLALSDFTGTTPSYETVVDNNGVPVYARTDMSVPTDFKRQPDGHYSVYRPPTPTAGRTGGQVVELNNQFEQIGAYETVSPLVNTNTHDSILTANGDRWLIAEEGDQAGNEDDYIQEQNSAGAVLFMWDTDSHLSPTLDGLSGLSDYAHLNSIALMRNGDILASFRHMSQVMEIATSDHGGFSTGDIVWSLGGRRPTLRTVNDPQGGPCAQHDASVLPDGDILMFDDGSESLNGSPVMCANPGDPTGPAIARPQTRVVEYAIDPVAKTATLVWTYQIQDRDSNYLGSAQRLPNGNTLIGWGGNQVSLATEVNSAHQVLWELHDGGTLFSYRALRFAVPDAISPVVNVTQPTQGATYAFGQKVDSDFSCTDRGGSNLHSCSGPVAEGSRIDTATSGTHSFTVVAKDGAGNTTTVTRTYHVGLAPARYQPDAMVKRPSAAKYVGGNVYGTAAKQHISESIARAGKFAQALVRVQNDSNRTDQITIDGSAGTSRFKVAYFDGDRNITKQVVAGTYETPSLAPGHAFALRVKVTRTAKAKPGTSLKVKVLVTSVHSPTKHDAVATVIRAIS